MSKHGPGLVAMRKIEAAQYMVEGLDKGALTKWGIPLMSGCSSGMKTQINPLSRFVQRFLSS